MPDPNDPLGLMTEADPLGILGDDVPPIVPPAVPLHVQRPVAPPPAPKPVGGLAGVWGSGSKRPAGARKGIVPPVETAPVTEQLYQAGKGGLARATAALRRPFLPPEQDTVNPPSYNYITRQMDPGGPIPGHVDHAQQVLRDLAVEAQTDVDAAGGMGIPGKVAQFGVEMLPYLSPVTGAVSGVGTAQEQGKGPVGQLVGGLTGGAFGPIAAGPVRTIQALTRAPTVVATGLGGAASGAGMMATQAAETALFENNPELAQSELDAVLPAAGIGGGLTALMDMLTRGRGSFRRPMDLRPAPEAPPIDVPIREPAPAGVEAYLPPDVVARMKTQPVERNLLTQDPLQILDPQTLQTPETQGLTAPNQLSLKGGESMELPGGMAPSRPGARPEVVAEGSPVDPFTMQAKAPDPADPLGIMHLSDEDQVAARMAIGDAERAQFAAAEQSAAEHAARRAEFNRPRMPRPPLVNPNGTLKRAPTELSPAEAINAPAPRDLHGIDVDAPTREIDPAIIAEVQRAADQAERAKFATQMDELRARNRGESPAWKAERAARAAQAKADSTPEGRAAREADELSTINRRPDATATGLETVVDNSSVVNPFDSSAVQAPIASWFNDLAEADKYRTPAARKPVDIAPEARPETERGIAPISMGKDAVTDFNRAGFITKSQAAERARAPEADPSAETRVSAAVDPVETYIGSLPPENAAVARNALKGWDYKADPKGAVDNLKQVVQMATEKREKRRGKLQPAPKAAAEAPAKVLPEAPVAAGETAPSKTGGADAGTPVVQRGDAGEARGGDRPDAARPDPVGTDVGEAKQQPPAAPDSDAGGGRNLTRKGATVDPIDEVAKLVEKGARVAARESGAGPAAKLAKGGFDWYEAPLVERVGKSGGEVGKEFANRARRTNDRARELEGQLAPLTKKALDLVGTSKKGRQTGDSLMKVEWDGDFGSSRSHLAAEGKLTNIKPDEAAWADAHQKLFYASGKQAEDAGVTQVQANGKEIPFKADPNRKQAIRAPSDFLRWLADHPGDADTKKLIEHVAEKNGKTVEQMETLVKTAFGERSLERPAALEQARELAYFPSHMRGTDGAVHELLQSNPQTMVKSLATRTPMRTAFHETFGGENPKAGVEEFVKAGGERRDAEDLFRALNGMPVEMVGSGFRPGSGVDTFLRRLGMLMGVLRSGSLSVASAMNLPESFAKTFPMAGASAYLRALGKMARHPKDAQAEVESMGSMALHAFNWHMEPGKRAEQVERVVRDILGMPLHAVEQANVTWSAMAGALKAADLKAGKGTVFDRVRLNWLGFEPGEIKAIMDGTASPDLYRAVATRFPEWTQGHASRGSEVSRAGHSKWYQALTIADRFPRMTINRFMRAAKSIPDLMKQGKKGEAAAATALLTGMGLSHMASGAAGLLIRASLVGAFGATAHSLVSGEDKFNAWKDFLLKAFAGSLFGPAATAIGSTGEALSSGGDVRKAATGWIYPLSIAEMAVDYAQALAGKDQRPGSMFKDLSPGDATVKFLEARVPLTKVAANATAALGLGTRDMGAEAAMGKFWEWRRKYAPFPEGRDSEFSDFRIASKKAARMVQDGQDPTEYLEKALQVKMEGGSDRKKAFNSLIQSIRSRRILDDLSTDQRAAAEAYIGPENYEKIKTYDALLTAWAERLKAAK